MAMRRLLPAISFSYGCGLAGDASALIRTARPSTCFTFEAIRGFDLLITA
jgi:hypothetical protein